jgi:hypothetical protein
MTSEYSGTNFSARVFKFYENIINDNIKLRFGTSNCCDYIENIHIVKFHTTSKSSLFDFRKYFILFKLRRPSDL